MCSLALPSFQFENPADGPIDAPAAYGLEMYVMIDFVLGFAFVAMILSPGLVAVCLRRLLKMDYNLARAASPARAGEMARCNDRRNDRRTRI
jgi:hypothetical protein